MMQKALFDFLKHRFDGRWVLRTVCAAALRSRSWDSRFMVDRTHDDDDLFLVAGECEFISSF